MVTEHTDLGETLRTAEAVVRRFEAAWNHHDMDALAALLTPDAHWVNTVGMHWQGRDQVHAGHAAFHAGMFKTVSLRLEAVESAQPVGPEVIVAVCRIHVDGFSTPTGERPPSRDRLTVVLARTGDGWRIAHGANVPIFEPAQAHDPVRGGGPSEA